MIETYELSTSFGSSKISFGISFPVKNNESSLEKLLQLWPNRLYADGLNVNGFKTRNINYIIK